MRRTILAAATVLAVAATGCSELEPLSTREALERMHVASTKVYAADGTLIANLHGEIDRDIVPLEDIPEHVRNAVIAIEDRRFWTHAGLDLQALSRAALENLRSAGSAELQGGSTITQQLVKNLYFPKPERTISRKLSEARITLQFEDRYEKARILEMYLNTVYFGRGVYGIQAASQSYFRKDAGDLTAAEGAFLAGLIHEPGRYEWSDTDPPDRQAERKERATARRNTVLRAMRTVGFLDEDETKAAVETPLEVAPPRENRWRYPYFTDMVLRELGVLRDGRAPVLDPRYDMLGKTAEERAATVYRGGLRIHTTLIPKHQEAAERAIAEILPEGVDKLSAAAVAVDSTSGYVRALVGGRNYYPQGCDKESPEQASVACRLGKVNLALGERGGGSGRQPGSSFKPLVLATALQEGVTLRRSFSAAPFTHDLPAGPWKVRNYEGSGGGRMDLIEATVKSVNAAYARLEIHGIGEGNALAGSAKVAQMARRLGIPFDTEEHLRKVCGDRYGYTGDCTPADAVPAIALGAKEVSPLEMASAYASFANDGIYVRPRAILKITDASGKVIYQSDPEAARAMDSDVANTVTHVLQEVIKRGTGTRAAIGRPAAGKTGTSQMWRDAWFVGFVPQLTTAVWVGNPIPVKEPGGTWSVESMTPRNGYPIRVTGGSYPARIWSAFMSAALEGVPEQGFPPPADRFFKHQSSDPDEKDSERITDDDLREQSEISGTTEQAAEESRGRTPRATSSRSSGGSGSVPSVIGMSPARARTTLRNAGYGSSGVRQCPPGGSNGMRVWRQSPGGGSSAPRGSTVTFWYSPAVC